MNLSSLDLPRKRAVQQAFDRAAARYDQAASIQKQICHRLFADINLIKNPETILDAGCGTGFGSQLLCRRYPFAQIAQLDLSMSMLKQNEQPIKTVGDLEQLPIANNAVDLYWSSLSVQWCDLTSVLQEAHRVLKPAGTMAIATLGRQTFRELRTAFAQIDTQSHTLNFVDSLQVEHTAKTLGFSKLCVLTHTETTYHANLGNLLHSIKAVGANQIDYSNHRRPLTRQALAHLTDNYEKMRTAQGLPLTYQVIRLYATNP